MEHTYRRVIGWSFGAMPITYVLLLNEFFQLIFFWGLVFPCYPWFNWKQNRTLKSWTTLFGKGKKWVLAQVLAKPKTEMSLYVWVVVFGALLKSSHWSSHNWFRKLAGHFWYDIDPWIHLFLACFGVSHWSSWSHMAFRCPSHF